MPGGPVPRPEHGARVPTLEEPLARALREIRRELRAWQEAVEGRVAEALAAVRPLVAAVAGLREESAALRLAQERLQHRVRRLGLPETDLGALVVASGDPGAHFSAAPEPPGPLLAHPPAFSATRRHPESRRGSATGPF